ncbi:unnamed protein product, partial [Ranitomeya imitator]
MHCSHASPQLRDVLRHHPPDPHAKVSYPAEALFAGLPREHPESYHSFMWNNLFKHIDIIPENAHILDGNAPDLQTECNLFEEKIKAAGGIELFVG